MARVLIVDDDPDIREILADRLAASGYEVLEAADGKRAVDVAVAERPDLLLLDLDLPAIGGMDVLDRLREEKCASTVVVITAHASIGTTVEAMRRGAYDVIPKPFDSAHVELVVGKALERVRLRQENRALRAQIAPSERPWIGSSAATRRTVETARRAAESKSTILLLGESGTGKEILARAIHGWSPRAAQAFVAVNCAALSEELLESELFGHERGSFTGAHQQKIGKFELANGGTIFLDEIGELKEELQIKLLRVLQEHEFERVGGTRTIRTDLRVIAATNREIEEAVRAGRFREDLFYRLNVVAIRLPPLRDRREDVPELAEHFLELYREETGRTKRRLSPEALVALAAHDWPGNVRELKNAIERAVVLALRDEIEPADLGLAPAETKPVRDPEEPGDGGFHERVEAFKRELIEQTLAACEGNRTRAAEALGLQRTYLARLIKNLGIDA
jgi:two-component system, NtrC family, response regulator AtoC